MCLGSDMLFREQIIFIVKDCWGWVWWAVGGSVGWAGGSVGWTVGWTRGWTGGVWGGLGGGRGGGLWGGLGGVWGGQPSRHRMFLDACACFLCRETIGQGTETGTLGVQEIFQTLRS